MPKQSLVGHKQHWKSQRYRGGTCGKQDKNKTMKDIKAAEEKLKKKKELMIFLVFSIEHWVWKQLTSFSCAPLLPFPISNKLNNNCFKHLSQEFEWIPTFPNTAVFGKMGFYFCSLFQCSARGGRDDQGPKELLRTSRGCGQRTERLILSEEGE